MDFKLEDKTGSFITKEFFFTLKLGYKQILSDSVCYFYLS